MALESREVSFHHHDRESVLDGMTRLARDSDGQRWVNIEPDIDQGEIHTGSLFWRMFSSRGPVIPKLTWVPAHTVRGRRQHTQVGLSHATGANAIDRLGNAGVEIPSGWVTVQDHTRRGLLFALPDDQSPDVVVSLAVAAIRALSPFEFEDHYLATFWSR